MVQLIVDDIIALLMQTMTFRHVFSFHTSQGK